MADNRMQNADEILIEKAKAFVIKRQEASCSLLQREFGWDFTTAVNVMMELERLGIVGEFDGVDTRKVLMKNSFDPDRKNRDTKSVVSSSS